MKQYLLVTLLTMAFGFRTSAETSAETELPLIPWPDSVVVLGGDFRLTSNARIIVSDETLMDEATLFAATLQQYHGLSLATGVGKKSEDGDVHLILDPKMTGAEGPTGWR